MKRLKQALFNGSTSVFREVEQGRAQLVETMDGNLTVIVRFERKEMVIVAASGRGLRRHRQALINYAVTHKAMSIRWHTIWPERLMHAMEGLNVQLLETRPRFLRRTEYVYRLGIM